MINRASCFPSCLRLIHRKYSFENTYPLGNLIHYFDWLSNLFCLIPFHWPRWTTEWNLHLFPFSLPILQKQKATLSFLSNPSQDHKYSWTYALCSVPYPLWPNPPHSLLSFQYRNCLVRQWIELFSSNVFH